jgi:hypothetical protein
LLIKDNNNDNKVKELKLSRQRENKDISGIYEMMTIMGTNRLQGQE